jgi:glyoxylase-like metal-dependent hydrolase (beta-lactamase superfamily II)
MLKDGEAIKAGDCVFEVIHTPGHSQDSICLYCEEEKALFAGDTPLIIHRPGNSYHPEFIEALEKICRRDVQAIYFGHGQPMSEHCNERLRRSLRHVTHQGD